MKIAFRISKMSNGGAERVFLSVAEQLASMYGAQIDFVVDSTGKGETENVVTKKGFSLIDLKSARTLHTIFPLKQYIESHQPDILISAYTDTNFAAIISTKLAKSACKIIVSEHAPIKEHWQNVSLKRGLLLKSYIRFGYRFADHILLVSKGLMAEIMRFGHSANKTSYIYNPVRFSATNLPKVKQKTDLNILAVGRISKAKDYLTLLKAFKVLVDEKYNAHLNIVGAVYEAAEKSKLDQFILENNLSPNITFTGFTEDVQSYYQAADVFVLSSAWEGFGNVLVEALAFGLPIVSTDCNYGPREVLQDGKYGQLVSVGDWQAMATALPAAFDGKNSINKLVLQQRSLDFSEAAIAAQYWQLIQHTIQTQ